MPSIEEIRPIALGMSAPDRAELARDLLASLEEPESRSEAEEQWHEEILARSEAYERGEAIADDWQKSLARVRDALQTRKAGS